MISHQNPAPLPLITQPPHPSPPQIPRTAFCLNPAKTVSFPHNPTSPGLPGSVWITSPQLPARATMARDVFECSVTSARGSRPPKLNYDIYDKELLAIIEAFRQWWAYLEGSATAKPDELPLAKFTYNNMPHSASGVFPFYANKGYNPQLTLSLKDIPSHVTHQVTEDLRSLHQFLRDEINTAN
ncbi:hypothetical protein E4T56_gene407 [Termitomyces sp. T112]|nr:hypothetical protein E4T56_gene407 [Termitomyces sp. T112]